LYVFPAVSGLALQFTEEIRGSTLRQQARWKIIKIQISEYLIIVFNSIRESIVIGAKKKYNYYHLSLFFMSILIIPSSLNSVTSPYGKISPERYLSGRFNPANHELFVSLKGTGIPVDKKKHYLRREAVVELKRMIDHFHRDHPNIRIWVRSSTRNFYSQKYIWESKWSGRRLVNGKRLNETIGDPLKRAEEILKYSSMPGTSRHHWGTDFDINKLTNDYYSDGHGRIIYEWLNENAHKYGFCQPYTAGRSRGYYEEKWHWSYLPLAKIFLRDWNRLFGDGKEFRKKGLFRGSSHAGHLAPVYVNSINGTCR